MKKHGRVLALYDPDMPSRCCLVTQLPLGMTLAAPGRWDSPTGKVWETIIAHLVVLIALLAGLGFLLR